MSYTWLGMNSDLVLKSCDIVMLMYNTITSVKWLNTCVHQFHLATVKGDTGTSSFLSYEDEKCMMSPINHLHDTKIFIV